jgi:hypothetical protein
METSLSRRTGLAHETDRQPSARYLAWRGSPDSRSARRMQRNCPAVDRPPGGFPACGTRSNTCTAQATQRAEDGPVSVSSGIGRVRIAALAAVRRARASQRRAASGDRASREPGPTQRREALPRRPPCPAPACPAVPPPVAHETARRRPDRCRRPSAAGPPRACLPGRHAPNQELFSKAPDHRSMVVGSAHPERPVGCGQDHRA